MKKISTTSIVFACAMVFSAIFAAIYFGANQFNVLAPDSIDITKVSNFNFYERNDKSVYYDNSAIARVVTYHGEEVSSPRLSPSQDKLGFYHDKPGDERAGKDVALEVMDIETKDVTMVYEGDYKTSNWEWIDDGRVMVYYNCGSPCYAFTIISTEGEVLHEMSMHGLSYALSPDKQWLLGFVDWARKLGVIVMNIETKKEYELVQADIPGYPYGEYVKAVWSPDSKKLAVLNKHSNSRHLAATVYDVVNDFQILHQQTIECQLVVDDVQCDIGDNGPERFIATVLEAFGGY